MDIGFVIPTLYKGGAERVASELSQLLPNVHLILFEKRISYPYSGKLHVLDLPLSSNFALEQLNILQRSKRLKKLAKEHGIDLFIAFDERASFSSILSGIPTIATIHKSLKMADREKNPLIRALANIYRKLYIQAKCVVSPSYSLTNELKSLLKAPCFKTIYNPLDVEGITRKAQEGGAPEGPYALNIGRAVPQKNPLALLDIFTQEPLYILSRAGPLLPQLLAKAPPNVKIITEWVENIYPWYKNASYYVSTSNYEGFSMAIAEAMALGKPSLSTDCPHGPAELLGEVKEDLGNGFVLRECGITGPLIKPSNIPHYRHWAKEMFEMGFSGCQERAKRLFSPERIKREWLELFKTILK